MNTKSHLTRGAWIEIPLHNWDWDSYDGRTSHEVRGLKYYKYLHCHKYLQSHLTRGAWIEIPHPPVT